MVNYSVNWGVLALGVLGVPCTLANSALNKPIVSLAKVNLSLKTKISDFTLPLTSMILSRVFVIFSSTGNQIEIGIISTAIE